MDIVESEAKQFVKLFVSGLKVRNLQNLKSDLDTKLWIFNSERDKYRFSIILKNQIESDIADHKVKCHKPDHTCEYVSTRLRALFIINQQIESLQDYERPNTDNFTGNEQAVMYNRIDSITQKLADIGLGQEILFNELQELKERMNLGKKSFLQLAYGKVTEMVATNIIDNTIGKEILSTLTSGFDNTIRFLDGL